MTMLFPDRTWQKCTPEQVGIPSAAVEELCRALNEDEAMHGMMILRGGKLAAECYWSPFTARMPHNMFSASKAFTSTLIGIAQEEGLLNIHQRVWDFFPEYGEPEGYASRLTIQHLLTMTVGHETEVRPFFTDLKADRDWVELFLKHPIEHEPGTHFLYNTAATYMLSAILTRVTGKTMLEYGMPRLFEPLGIRPMKWLTCPKGITTGGFGLLVNTDGLARLGHLYLNGGMWKGKRILSTAWVADASSWHSVQINHLDNWNKGYGYQFWLNNFPNSYRADGYAGQFSLILPDYDMVIALTMGAQDPNAQLNKVWNILMPHVNKCSCTLPEDESALSSLKAYIENAAHPLPTPVTLPGTDVKTDVRYLFPHEDNDLAISSLKLAIRDPKELIVEMTTKAGASVVRAGMDGLFRTGPMLTGTIMDRVAAKALWEGNKLTLTLMPIGEPWRWQYDLTFAGESVQCEAHITMENIFSPNAEWKGEGKAEF